MKERRNLCVVKVGGSLLRDGKSYIEAAENIKKIFVERDRLPIVVVSAAKGVTDLLIEVAKGSKTHLEAVVEKYMSIANEFASPKLSRRVYEELEHLRRVANTISGSFDAALQDLIISFGERISKILMVEALENANLRAVELNARELIMTNNIHGDASIDYVATANNLEKIINSILETSAIPVIEGFIGATEDGVITTLGRGGSDYTATAIASLLGIDDVYLVTEVDGIMTADPALIPSARIVKVMSYREAMEAALHGAKRINPKAFEPLEKFYGSTVFIGSWRTFGTRIQRELSADLAGPKLAMCKTSGDIPYIAIIGEGVGNTKFLKMIIDILYEKDFNILGIQSYYYRPSILVYVQKTEELKILRELHKSIFEGVGS
ncbi:MAG: aspartate kinase [Ignisphaera sp.]